MWPFSLQRTSTLSNKWNFWLSKKQHSSWLEHTLLSVSLWPWSCDLLLLTFLIICCNLEGPARSVHTLSPPCMLLHYSGICALNAVSLPWAASPFFRSFPVPQNVVACQEKQKCVDELTSTVALATDIINTELPCHPQVREKVYTCPLLSTDRIRHKGKKCQRW